MNRPITRVCVAAFVAATTSVSFVAPVAAQVEPSGIGSEQGGLESSQLITSNAEVRRAVIGLLAIAGVALIVFLVYWRFTGRAAKRRFEHQFGGRHAVAGRPRRRRRRDRAGEPADQERTAVAPGEVEPPRRRLQAQAVPVTPGPFADPRSGAGRAGAGWDGGGPRQRVGIDAQPGWVDQTAPGPLRPSVARHALPGHDPERPWRDADDRAWPRPFEGR